jgi:ABC-type transport system substrate-binding protein
MTTDKPFATALNALAHGAGLMVSPAAIKEYDDHLEHHPVGTGPYKLENFNVGSELTLVANQAYFGGAPKVQNLIYRHIPEASTRVSALLAGEVHVINAVPPQQALRLANETDVKVVSIPGLRPYQVNLNLTREVFQDKQVRQALNYAVSKQAIAKGIFLDYAKPADSPLAFNTTGYATAGSYTYDPQKASELLSQAGWKDTNDNGILDKNGQEFEVTVITPDGWLSQDLEIIQAVARQLETVGIKIIINKVEPASFWGPITAPADEVEWDMAFFGFNPSNAAGVYHLESLYLSDSDPKGAPRAWNMMRYKNSEVDSLLTKANQTVSPEDRFKLLADAQKIIWDDAPAIWLVIPEVIAAHRTGLKGVEVWPITFTILRGVGE